MTGEKKTGARERTGSQIDKAGETYNEKSYARLAVTITEKDAIVAIEHAMAKYSCLSRDGMGLNLFDPDAQNFSLCGVITAMGYLRQFPRQPPQYSSDWLKDKAQEWGGQCAVANGELIIAAMHLGLPIKWNDGPNVVIGVGRPQARCACDRRVLH